VHVVKKAKTRFVQVHSESTCQKRVHRAQDESRMYLPASSLQSSEAKSALKAAESVSSGCRGWVAPTMGRRPSSYKNPRCSVCAGHCIPPAWRIEGCSLWTNISSSYAAMCSSRSLA